MQHSLLEAIPFIGVIFSISVFPLFNADFWHKNSKKILLAWCIVHCTIEMISHGAGYMFFVVFESIVKHYIPFLLLIGSLFITTSGIFVNFPHLRPSAMTNTIFLFCSSLLAGWIGTTGASSLFIRPFLRINSGRKYKVHLVIFFILLVSNIGGAASPIGDPPLFIGFLEGVNFFWFFKNLFWYLIFAASFLCAIFYCIDKYLWNKNDHDVEIAKSNYKGHIEIKGFVNIMLLFSILSCLILCEFDGGFSVFGLHIKYCNVLRDILLAIIAFISMNFGHKEARRKNDFSYAPMIEVAEVFLAIFITVVPLLEMLAIGKNGPFSSVFSFIAPNGNVDPVRCFWAGSLSSILDNTPTFLIFFYMAGGNAIDLMTTNSHTLIAISLSSVFMGALTYIGNAPNLMIRSIAESARIKMPSFIWYMAISVFILLPIFITISFFL